MRGIEPRSVKRTAQVISNTPQVRDLNGEQLVQNRTPGNFNKRGTRESGFEPPDWRNQVTWPEGNSLHKPLTTACTVTVQRPFDQVRLNHNSQFVSCHGTYPNRISVRRPFTFQFYSDQLSRLMAYKLPELFAYSTHWSFPDGCRTLQFVHFILQLWMHHAPSTSAERADPGRSQLCTPAKFPRAGRQRTCWSMIPFMGTVEM